MIVFIPISVWAYESDRKVMFAVTMFCGWAALWIVGLFGVVWVAACFNTTG